MFIVAATIARLEYMWYDVIDR